MAISIGIAGSNGKTTTINILSTIMRNSGKRVKIVDDIKIQNAQIINSVNEDESVLDYVIYELSAKTLESLNIGLDYNFGFDISLLLNINKNAPESLELNYDNANKMQKNNYYENVIAKVYEGTKKLCIFNAADYKVDQAVQDAEVEEGVKAIGFSTRTPSRSQVGVVENEIVDRAFYEDNTNPLRFLNANSILSLSDFSNLNSPLNEPFNWLISDVCAAISICRACGLPPESIKNGLHQFRLKSNQAALIYKRDLKLEPEYYFGEINYINDTYSQDITGSKSNILSLHKNSVIWIGGGDSRFLDYTEFTEEIKGNLLAAVIIGTKNSPIYNDFINTAPNIPLYLIEPTIDLKWVEMAVKKANDIASENNSVIFSPAAKLSSLGDPTQISDEVTKQFEILKNKYTTHARIHEFTEK